MSTGPSEGQEGALATGHYRSLVELSGLLAECRDAEEMSLALSKSCDALAGAMNSTIAIVDPELEVVYTYRGPNSVEPAQGVRVVPLSQPTPVCSVIRSGEPENLTTPGASAQRFPEAAAVVGSASHNLLLAMHPIAVDNHVLGSVLFRWRDPGAVPVGVEQVMAEVATVLGRHLQRVNETRELEETAERLRRSNAELENFAAIVAHDLRGPVRRIGSFTQLLMRNVGPTSQKADGYAQTIQDQVRYLDDLLRDLLDFSTAMAGGVSRHPVDLGQLFQRVETAMKVEAQQLEASISAVELPVVMGEGSLLRQVLANLIQNSLKYRSEAPPVITLSSEKLDYRQDIRWWKISVRDNGIGMADGSKEAAFQMFRRLNPHDGKGGTGIGLAFCQRVIEHHGGEIGFESAPGRGTTVWFTLPGMPETRDLDQVQPPQ